MHQITARPRAFKAIDGLVLGAPLSLAMWLVIGLAASQIV